ncbi:hypothetical protein [Salinithrix halophila]|uniref:hypothetical protein n=1 Tax=Salinithrix halophila TaxID=1485204 RepID=UPI0036D2A99D
MVWYLECAQLSASEMYRALWQMRENGWFQNTRGLLFGRLAHTEGTRDLPYIDALEAVFSPLQIPVVFDTDLGHLPPQLTLVNGALAKVEVYYGKGRVEIAFL